MAPILRSSLVVALVASAPAVPGPPAQDPSCRGDGEGDYRVVELKHARAEVMLFGARHRTDPSDPIFAEIERRVAAFSPTVFLAEGEGGSGVPASKSVAIERGGELGFACWLAAQRGVPCLDADLTEAQQAERLTRRHPPEEVLLYYAIGMLGYFNARPPEQGPPGDVVEWILRRVAPKVGLPRTTKADLAAIWERTLHRPFDPGAVTTEWHDPFKDDTVIQRISREDNDLREPFMVEQLLKAARPGARVFAIFGEGHVCNLREPLREALARSDGAE